MSTLLARIGNGGIRLPKVKDLFNGIKKGKHFLAFLPSLLVSFISIIILCTFIMGILSYNVVKSFMTDRIIASNNKLLNQYKTSIDIALVETVDNMSLQIMHDINSTYELKRYFNESLEKDMADIPYVSNYLKNMKVVNPLVFSLAVYYSNNNLLISTDYIRHTLYRPLEEQKDLSNYYHIVQKAAENRHNSEDQLSLIFDYGKNLDFKPSDVRVDAAPKTIIHAVRISYGYNKSIKGAVIVTVSGDIFKSFLSKYAPEDLGSIFIFDEDGTIISHTDNDYIGHDISELGYKKLYGKGGRSGYFLEEINGVPSVVSYQSSSYDGWTYVSTAPIEAISSVTAYILRILIIVALVSVSVGIAVSFAEAKKLAKPMKSIVNYCIASPYAAGFIQAKRDDEYSLIGKTFNSMEALMKEKEAELVKVLPMIKMNFLSALLSDSPPDSTEISARMKMLGIGFSFKFFCAAAVKLEKLQESEKVILYEYEKISICSKLNEIFTTDHCACLYYEKDNTITVLLNFDSEENAIYELGRTFFDQTKREAAENISILKYLSFGKIETDIRHMNTSFKMALKGLDYSYVFPERDIFTFGDILGFEQKRSFSNKLLLNNLANSLRSLNCEKSQSDIENLIKTIRNGSFSYQQIYATLSTCVSMVESFICTHLGKEIDLEKEFNNTPDILKFEIWIKKVIQNAFGNIEDVRSDNKYIVAKAQEFIGQNIQNAQLSLEYVAKELGINYKYLSRVFKSETGVKFIDYVTNVKLNYCRNLLINTDLKVEEISDIMKYSTSHYFISRFKMMFGCTPKEYRNNYQNAKNVK